MSASSLVSSFSHCLLVVGLLTPWPTSPSKGSATTNLPHVRPSLPPSLPHSLLPPLPPSPTHSAPLLLLTHSQVLRSNDVSVSASCWWRQERVRWAAAGRGSWRVSLSGDAGSTQVVGLDRKDREEEADGDLVGNDVEGGRKLTGLCSQGQVRPQDAT